VTSGFSLVTTSRNWPKLVSRKEAVEGVQGRPESGETIRGRRPTRRARGKHKKKWLELEPNDVGSGGKTARATTTAEAAVRPHEPLPFPLV
jgi:hypothetical protein